MNLLDILFPKFCVDCGKLGSYICKRCTKNILQGDLICPNCEKPSIGGKTHPLCQKKYGLDGLWSLGIYQGLLQEAIQKMKYNFVFDLGATLIDLVIEYWAKNTPYFLEEVKKETESWVITYIPLNSRRERWRGFNQAKILAKLLASKIGLKAVSVLKRTRNTKPQVSLSASKRYKNIKDAFVLANSYKQSLRPNSLELRTTSFLLVDDVWTTGATLKECCLVLKKAGAKKVWGITLAR